MLAPKFNTPALPEMACPYCDVIDLPRLGAGSGPHAARADCAHCSAFLRWLPRPRTAAERAEKNAQAELHHSACMREKLPTPQQIQYLQRLGYCGPRPSNRRKGVDMNNECTPKELRRLRQWVNWRYETRDGRPTKVPYSPHAPYERASSTDSSTWGEYSQALLALRRADVNGLGFVFTADDDYTGIDLDKCVDAAGVLEPWAQSIVDAMDSYTELSPSGRGLHIIIRGKLPPGRRRRGRIEAYDQGRYFTMTGDSFGPPKPIVLRDIELEAFIESYLADARPTRPASSPLAPAPSGNPMPDRDVLLRMLSCAAGPRIRRLWRGDTTGYGSASEADLALVAHLLWWCKGNRDQVDRLFRMSGLYREKWDRTDYRERTLNVAMEG